jgi:hypothetical protein
MTESTKDQLAALKKKVEELEAKVSPPQSTFVPMSDAEHRDMVHRMRERQANSWMPPDAIREMVAAEPKGFMHDVALRDSRAPTGRPGMIPDSQQPPPRRSAGGGTGWGHSAPLGPPPGVAQADRLMDAQDQRDRAELVEREARLRAMEKMAGQTEAMRKQTEALAKLAEKNK